MVNGKFYVMGGDDFNNGLNTTFIYDIATDTWTTGATLPDSRTNLYGTAANGLIYVYGGVVLPAFTTTDTLLRYDPVANSWSNLGSAGTGGRGNYGGISPLGTGQLLIADGADGTGASTTGTHIFDISGGTFSVGPAMMHMRAGHAQGTLPDGRVLVADGFDTASTTTTTVELLTSSCPTGTPTNTPTATATPTATGSPTCTPGQLTTLFATDNNGSPGGAVYFDVTVAANTLSVTGFDINTDFTGAFSNMQVWVLPGMTSVGNETNMGLWTQVATGSGTGAGTNVPTHVTLSNPFALNAGTLNGIALIADPSFGHFYTNGTGGNQNYSNADLSIALGSATNVPFTAPVFSPRVWNGTIYYGGVCGTPTATPTNTPTSTPTGSATPTPTGTCTPSGTPTTLYDQTDNAGTTATSSQNFEAAFDTFDSFTADDFVVPAGQTWNVSTINVGGQYFNGTGPAATVNVFFYPNSGTLPGSPAACTFNNVAIASGAATGSFGIDLPSSCTLGAGTYWVSVQANLDFTPNGQWGWNDRTVQTNNGAAFMNPGGGFACTGGNGWVLKTTCVTTTSPDQIFSLVGTTGGVCGTPTPTGTATNTPTATPTGTPTTGCGENFDGVTAPALPAGWTTSASGVEVPWVTSTNAPDTAPNEAFAPDPNNIGNTELFSPAYAISAGGGSFSFRNNYNTESTFDGMVLEISIDGGAYADILAAGGSFVTGGYNATISTAFMSPIAGRMAWSGNSGGYITSTVMLPAAANGHMINLKWRMASDNSVAAIGVMVDTITSIPCNMGTPTPTTTPTNTPTATPTITPTPGMASVQFDSDSYYGDESQTEPVTLNRTGDTSITTTVMFTTTDGTAHGGAAANGTGCGVSGVDYILITNMPVTFNPGETAKTVFVTICGDSLHEATETINLSLTGASVGTPSQAVMFVNDTANTYRASSTVCTTLGNPASPYPSTITVSGAPSEIGSMRVTLYDVTHEMPDNMDILLIGPTGQNFILVADAGGNSDLTTPVTLTFSDLAGQVLPDSAPFTTGQFEPTSWEPGQSDFPAPAPPGPYNEPGSAVGGTGTQTLVGNFGMTNANGTWSLYMRDDAGTFTPEAITGCLNGGWGLEFLSSTAANASISGRVLTADGRGIRNAKVVITGNSLPQARVATTSSFGYFTFDGLPTGQTYVVTVNSKRYTFSVPSQVVSLVDNVVDIQFVADGQ